jgi:hypothetical protein
MPDDGQKTETLVNSITYDEDYIMSNTIEILNRAETLKKINSLRASSARIVENVQAAAIGALSHAAEHGDLSLCTKLVNAVSASHGTQLRKYLTAFAPITWNKGKGFTKVKRGGAFRVSDAIEVNWDKFEGVASKPKAYDSDKARAALIRSLDKFAADALANDDGDLVATLAKIAATL